MSGFRVQKKMRSTCIFKPECTLNLDRLVKTAIKNDTYRVCHHSDEACCRGFWERYKDSFNLGRIAQRLNAVRFVEEDKHERGE